jgi:cysteine-rich repeat protein
VKRGRLTAGSFAEVLNPLAVLSPLVGIVVSLAGALPARGGEVPFTEHVISTIADGAISVFATDLDGDGNTDVLSASFRDDKIAWYESDGGLPPTFTERVISTAAEKPRSVFATDVDGDGDTDVLSASSLDNKVAWHENDGGSPPAFTERVISTSAIGVWSVFAGDLDGDGDTDVLSASPYDDKIAWYESGGGSPPTFTERFISTTADGALCVFAADLDGDGDTDVLSASWTDDKIAWYESDGGSPPTFTERVISTTADAARSVFATDLDGDGDTDVLSASWLDDKIAWYENDGGSSPIFIERVISTAADGAESVFATDLDGDGDIDVLSASWVADKIAWHESDGGLPPSFTEWVISTAADGAYSVFATDVDVDGDTDVLSASADDDKIAWYANITPRCGDGTLEATAGEACDDGFTDDCGTCNADCTGPGNSPICGDGQACPEFEECDDGGTDHCDGCDSECIVEECGNGKTQCNEACDDGATDACGTCNADCTGPGTGSTCGDGELCPEFEACDDAGETPTCDADCTLAECGDGTLNVTAGEECDDGNTRNGDGCSSTCQIVVQIPVLPQWALVVIALFLLMGGTIIFGGRRRCRPVR